MPSNHADSVHDMLDWIGPKISLVSEKGERDKANRELADECIQRMNREGFTAIMIKEVALHVQSFSMTVSTRIRTQFPHIFASGDDTDYLPFGAPAASVTEQ